jgi:HAE1 family hydrophobic/amphiphilic exporter-1
VIYVILGILYESFIHPITIMSGLPSAGIGAFLTLMYFHMELSVIAMIGIVMLVGIVKKNAIMMVDFALERRKIGRRRADAIRDAALVRFRPIMMTSFAAIFGTCCRSRSGPAPAPNCASRSASPWSAASCVSQLLTLYITPVVYFYLDKVDSFISGRGRGEREEAASVPGAIPVAIPQVVHRQPD